MWYLIIPPIIVVASLSFVLWYLSRKGADPAVAKKALQLEGEAEQRVSFIRVKTWALGLLEKIVYRFKVVMLRLHNSSHNLAHSLKDRKRRFHAKSLEAELPEQNSERVAIARSFWRKYKTSPKESREESLMIDGTEEKEVVAAEESGNVSVVTSAIETETTETTLKMPITRKRERFSPEKKIAEIVQMSESQEEILTSRPMVSEMAVRPEKETMDRSKEEYLIAHISANPKDFAAYEALGDYYIETGNLEDAKQCYRQVLKLSPGERAVRIKIRRLEKILSQ